MSRALRRRKVAVTPQVCSSGVRTSVSSCSSDEVEGAVPRAGGCLPERLGQGLLALYFRA